MNDAIRIRQATLADTEALIDLRARMLVELGLADVGLLETLRRNTLEWYAQSFADGSTAGWLAERDGVVIGGVALTLATGQPQFRSPSGRTALVYGLFVQPEERGAGVATRLVSEAVAHARAWGAEVVTLHAAEKARPLYARLGFRPTGEMRLQFSERDLNAGC